MTGNRIEFEMDHAGGIHVRTFGGSDCRAECAVEILTDLTANAPEYFAGRTGGIWFCDGPPEPDWVSRYDLAFCSTKRMAHAAPCLPFPCPMFLRWPQVGIPNAEELMSELLADDAPWEDERMFWIGADTHPSRVRLCELGNNHPDLFDTEIMQWDRGAAGGQRSMTRQVSLPGHRKYKYLIDCPGYGYSARIKWLLATGRPLFIVERDTVEHWHEEMQPWVHFVPVARDLSDLLEHRAIIEADPSLYENIGRQAREFAAERLTVEARLRETLEALDSRHESFSKHRAAAKAAAASHSECVQIVNGADLGQIEILFRDFLAQGDTFLWCVDERVWPNGDLDAFRASFDGCEADLLATELRTYAEDQQWTWWSSLKARGDESPLVHGVAALLPLMRVSRAAAEAVLKDIEAGWTGHPEALIPTLVNRAGLKIEDIGGTGRFTPENRICRWYDPRCWHWQGPVDHVPGKLHFPVPIQRKPLVEGRIEDRRLKTEDCGLKMLYVSPVGNGAAGLLPGTLERFLAAGADCLLLQYDDAELPMPDGVRVIREKGQKWQLALRHLGPETLREYDFIFFWDDDLGTDGFDPARFARIMRTNRLDMAQPAIRSPHGYLSHAITGHHPCPAPWRDPDGVTVRPVVGRLTNFVEIMAPVFTREGWREFYSYLDAENHSGWGYDYIPLGRKGIVDALPVVHTRPVQSINDASRGDLTRFLENQGLLRHAPVDMGWLFG